MSPLDFPYRVYFKSPNTDTDHIEEWCYEHFGLQGKQWDCWFANESPYNFDQYYAFVRHEDAVLFKLRWGGD